MKNWLDDLVDQSAARKHIAWAGELEFKSATENDNVGRTVQFILRREQKELGTAHPFSAHTRRRRGRAGTMFHAALTGVTHGNEFHGGMMLLNWASSPKGDTATFLLNYEAARHPFLGCTRASKDNEPTLWMAVFVEEDEQSAPVDQAQRAKIERPKQQIKNSNLAHLFTKNARFWQYIEEMYGEHVSSDKEADGWLKDFAGVDSKSEFDRHPKDAEFDALRIDFVDWQTIKFGPDCFNDDPQGGLGIPRP